MKNETAIIVLPIPPKCLSPNASIWSQRGRFMKAAALKKQRRLAKEAVEAEQIETAPWGFVTVKALFFYGSNRVHDEVNSQSTLKGAYDGIVDARLVTDDDHDHWRNLPPEFFVDRKNPRVVIYITKCEDTT